MANYQQYAEYKELESIFVEKIPANWSVKPLYTLCGFKQGKAHEPFIDDDGEFICVNARFVSTQGKGGSIKRCNVNLTSAKLNDILMVMSDLPNGRALARAFYVTEPKNNYAVNQRVCVITAREVHAKFLYYQLNRSPYFLMFDDGSNQTHLSNDSYKKYPVILPSTIEQTQIVNFLDYETAQIDTLIEKQQTLIQLLKEKRQAVISHAVTKGLNPDAPMKDSGVEWLDEVPEHWEVSKLKYYSSIQGGYAFSSDSFTKEGVQILKIGNVYQNRLALERQPTFVPEAMLEALPDFIVKDGDILMSLTGTLGKRDYGFAVAIKDDGKYLLNQRVAKLNPADEKIDRDFLLNVLWSESYLSQLYSLPSGTKQANLSNSDVLDIVITLPPSKAEQKEIAVELQNQKDIFDKAIQKAMISIELMQERRTALISAAVTGKIDVRGWRVPNIL